MREFGTAMSPATVVGIVGEWPGFREMGIAIDGCEVRKVRPKKHGGLEVEYRFDLVNSGHAHLAQVAPGTRFKATALGEYYEDDQGEKEYVKLLESLNGRAHLFADAKLRGFTLLFADLSLKGFGIYDAEHRLLLHSPLAGTRMRGLQVALDPEAMMPILGAYLPAGAGYPLASGQESLRRCSVEILRCKPGKKRCTLRYRLEIVSALDGQTRLRSLVGKVYDDKDQAERIFTVMRELTRRGFGPDAPDGIRIPQPLGYIDRLRMVLMEDVAGTPLRDRLASPQLADHLQAEARALAKLHQSPVQTDKERDANDRISELKRAVSDLTEARPELEQAFDGCLRQIKHLSDHLPTHEPVLVHGSLTPKEVLLDGDALTMVDLDTIALADPALDVGDVLAHIRWSGLQLGWPADLARSHAMTFLSAYREEIAAALMQRIDFYYRSCLLRIACRVSLRPKWQDLTDAFLAAVTEGYPF